MKTTIISFVIYTLIFAAVGGIIYFFAFWRPHGNRVLNLNRDIHYAQAELVQAALRDEMSPVVIEAVMHLGEELARAQNDWDYVNRNWQYDYLRFLPETFNELEMRERIYRIATSQSHNLQVHFQHSQPFGTMHQSYYNPYGPPEGLWLTPVDVAFTASYEGLVAILNGFAHEGIDNRIVEYTLQRQGDQLEVVIRLDILTRGPHIGNGYFNAAPHG